jgi:hypothetical protein
MFFQPLQSLGNGILILLAKLQLRDGAKNSRCRAQRRITRPWRHISLQHEQLAYGVGQKQIQLRESVEFGMLAEHAHGDREKRSRSAKENDGRLSHPATLGQDADTVHKGGRMIAGEPHVGHATKSSGGGEIVEEMEFI